MAPERSPGARPDDLTVHGGQGTDTFPFILGRGRSGTTLLRMMFDSHPEMAIPQESHFIVNLSKERDRYETPDGFRNDLFLRDLTDHWAFPRWRLPEDEVRSAVLSASIQDFPEAIRRVYELYAQDRGKRRYGDKTPSYVIHIPILASLFSEARFIHLIRDGRDVALSYLDMDFGPSSVAEAAIQWRRFVERGRSAGRRLGPERYREVRYEDLLEDPEGRLRDLCAFVELQPDPAMLRYYERAGFVTESPRERHRHGNLLRPLTKGLRDWRRDMSRHDVALFEALAGDLLEDLGYERGIGRVSFLTRIEAAASRVGTQVTRASRHARKQMRHTRRRSIGRVIPEWTKDAS
jgi:Sulfotransferase family